jgi:DNA polymerase elongation subunit (family B)
VLVRERLRLREKRLTSSAFGANNLQLLPGAGFAYVDTMLLCKVHPKKLRQNTLAAAAEAFLPPNDASAAKFDMPYEDIPGIAAGSDPVAWAALAGYCVQDCELVHKLLVAWDTTRDLVAQSRTINIPLAANVLCGQQQRVRDSVMLKARASAMVMNGVNVRKQNGNRGDGGSGDGDENAEPVTATGGFVLDNVAGFHDAPVVVLDFASLYPSVQRSRNLCWSTVVDDATWHALSDADRRALGIETHVTPTGTFRFATNVEGVFPAQLGDLLAARTAAKRDMAAAGRAKEAASAAMAAARAAGDDDALTAATEAYNVAAAAYLNADARQKATKIVMNSGYGTANADEATGVMPCRALGTTTCWVGAQLNRAAKAHVESKFGAVVLYGDTDSIMVVFPRRGAAAAPDADRFTILQDAFDQAEEAEASLNALFGEAEAKHAAAKAEALAAAAAAAAAAPEEVVPPKKTGQIVQTEAEKIYYPWASLGKKVYTGVKYEHRPKPDAPRDLGGTGSIEAKGMKMVRRDVPLFTRRLTQALLEAMLCKRDNAAFWGVVHDFVQRVCLGPREHGGGLDALPLSEFTITRELKEGFETQKPLGPQAAVAYAAEWACPGSCPLVGDRVAYAFVTTPDPRRIRRPPWMPLVVLCKSPKCDALAVWAPGPGRDLTRCVLHVPPQAGYVAVGRGPTKSRCVACGACAAWVGTEDGTGDYCALHVPKAEGWCQVAPAAEDGGGSDLAPGGAGAGAATGTGAATATAKETGTATVAGTVRAAAQDVALRSAYARSAAEIEANPDDNVLDMVYYVEKCVATVVEQLRPDAAAKPSIEAAITFAKRVASRANGMRGPSAASAALWSARCALEWAPAAAVDMPAVVAAVRAQQPLRVLAGSEVPVPGGGHGGASGGAGTGAGHGAVGAVTASASVHVKTASENRQAKAQKAAEAKRQAAALLRFLN